MMPNRNFMDRRLTMKTILSIVTVFLTSALFGQVNGNISCFNTVYFNDDGSVYMKKTDTITVDTVLSIDFYRKHFYKPTNYPRPFIDVKYKDTTISVWNDPLRKKDFESNWTYTTVYDRRSRATEYTYSGCVICSQMPYHVKVFYDKKNRPIRIEQRYGLGYKIVHDKLVKSDDKEIAETEYQFKYDSRSNIIQLKHLNSGKLNAQIDKM